MVLPIFWMFGLLMAFTLFTVGALLSIDRRKDFRNVLGYSMTLASLPVITVTFLWPIQTAQSIFEIAMAVFECIV